MMGKLVMRAPTASATALAMAPPTGGFVVSPTDLPITAEKGLINRGIEIDLRSALELEARCLGTLAATHDLHEGTLAFLEKRKPNFTD